MKCPKCQFDNRGGVKFCEECGTKFERTCPNCRAKIPLDRKFCGECGHNLQEPIEIPPIFLHSLLNKGNSYQKVTREWGKGT